MGFSAKNKSREYLEKRNLVVNDQKLMIYWNNNFYIWKNNFWLKQSFDEIRDDISLLCFEDDDFLEDCKSYYITDITRALKGYCRIKDAIPGTFFNEVKPSYIHYIAVKNGILKIDYQNSNFTTELLEHSSSFFNPNILPFEYNPNASCDKFIKFLNEILKDNESQLLLEWFGYNLIPVNYAQKFIVYFGPGANGKGIVSNIQRQLLGEANCSSLSLEEIVGNDRFKKSKLENKLANITDELDQVKSHRAGVFKLIVGGGVLFVEDKGDHPRPINPYSRLTFSTNILPRFDDHSDGILRRTIILPFSKQFLDESKQDKSLMDASYWEDQLSGIFNLSLQGLERLIKNNWKFTEPESVKQILNHYKQSTSPAIQFLKDYFELSEGSEISTFDLYQGYTYYCRINGHRSEDAEIFGKYVKKVFPSVNSTPNPVWRNKRRVRLWQGIKRIENLQLNEAINLLPTPLAQENPIAQKDGGNCAR